MQLNSIENEIRILVNTVFTTYISFKVCTYSSYVVDWGDGVVETFESNVVAEHVYSATTSIKDSLYGYNSIISIKSDTKVTNFKFCTPSLIKHRYNIPILAIDINCPNLLDTSYMFYDLEYGSYCGLLSSVKLSNFSKSSSCKSMFRGCSSLRYVYLGDLSSCLDLSFMFYGCNNLQYVEFSSNLDNVLSISNLFFDCESLVYFIFPSMNKLREANNVFVNCLSLRRLQSLNLLKCVGVSMDNFMNNCLEFDDNLLIGCSVSTLSLSNLPKLLVLELNKNSYFSKKKPTIYLNNVSIYTDYLNRITNNSDYNNNEYIVQVLNCNNINASEFNMKWTLVTTN